MSGKTVLKKFLNRGLRIWLDGERLKYSVPKSIADEAIGFLRKHKAEFIAYLRDKKAGDYEPSPGLPAGVENMSADPGPQINPAPSGISTAIHEQEEDEPIINERFIPATCRGCRKHQTPEEVGLCRCILQRAQNQVHNLTNPGLLANCSLREGV